MRVEGEGVGRGGARGEEGKVKREKGCEGGKKMRGEGKG